MGDQQVSPLSGQTKSAFLRHLLGDIEALEQMILDGHIESGVSRIGAEQEFCLVADSLRPQMTGPEILEALEPPQFTAELARWNLEINLDPQDTGPGCLQRMHDQLRMLLKQAAETSSQFDSHVLLTGILPTIRKSDLDFKYMTPNPRYRILDSILKEMRGEDFTLHIEGVDELNLRHDSILFEACNTSFQVHLQVEAEDFADRYNWAQVIAGPVLAACVNSPMLLGKELWSETRIGLFRQSLEIRHAGNYIRDRQPRVAFGYDWLKSSAVEIFKNDVAFYKLIIGAELDDEDSLALLARGEIPRLRAMNLHNGTLYKWNRACYGVGQNKPHLRIENRYIPSGPTSVDEMANAALWIGLMQAMPERCRGAWSEHFYFQDARCNFLKAARNGLATELRWFGKSIGSQELLLEELIPLAARGLSELGIPDEEATPYLDVMRARVESRQTGAHWLVQSIRNLRSRMTLDEATLVATEAMRQQCLEETPVHAWEVPSGASLVQVPNRYDRVDSIMVTNLVIVCEDDLVDFAWKLMEWNQFHHLPVENSHGEIAGVITARDIESFREKHPDEPDALVHRCMTSDILTVAPETSLEKAERTMLANEFGSLPVVRDNCVIGLITANDLRNLQKKIDSQ